jgi:hypothetical protein
MTDLITRTALRTKPSPDDRSSSTACIRRRRVGNDFDVRLHLASLVDRTGGRAFAPLTPPSQQLKMLPHPLEAP